MSKDATITVSTRRKPRTKQPSFEVLTGLDYGDRRASVGDVVSDIPAESIEWLLEQGHIKRVEESEAN